MGAGHHTLSHRSESPGDGVRSARLGTSQRRNGWCVAGLWWLGDARGLISMGLMLFLSFIFYFFHALILLRIWVFGFTGNWFWGWALEEMMYFLGFGEFTPLKIEFLLIFFHALILLTIWVFSTRNWFWGWALEGMMYF